MGTLLSQPQPALSSAAEAADTSLVLGLATFITNSHSVLSVNHLASPAAVETLSDLLSMSTEIQQLTLLSSLPAPLSLSRSQSLVSLFAGCGRRRFPGLFRTVAGALCPRIRVLKICSALFDADEANELCKALAPCTSICKFELARCEAETAGSWTGLATTIGRLRSLESLTLSENIGPLKGVTEELTRQELSPRLRKFKFRDLRVGEDGARAIARRTVMLRGLHVLELSDSWVEDKGLAAIVEALISGRCELRKLRLGGTGIGPDGATQVARLVRRVPMLRELDLSGNIISSVEACAAIGKSIACTKQLESLNLQICYMQPEHVSALLLPWHSGVRLRSLNLQSSPIGDPGAKTVSEYLLAGGGERLVRLLLGGDHITGSGGKELAKALGRLREISVLSLSANAFGPEAGAEMIDSIKPRYPMATLSVDTCQLGDLGAAAVGRFMLRVGCRQVTLQNNGLHAAGIKAIASAVASQPTASKIELLCLGENPDAGKEGAEAIAEGIIKPNNAVRVLVARVMGMGNEGMRLVADAVVKRKKGGELRVLQAVDNGCDEKTIGEIVEKIAGECEVETDF